VNASSPSKVVKVELKKGISGQQIFADRYCLEELDGFKLIHFGRAGQTRASAGVSLSDQAVTDASVPLKGFFEKLSPARSEVSFELRDLVNTGSVTPADMIQVSHRGSEGELIFGSFLLHELALTGASTKAAKDAPTIQGAAALVVRCPLPLIQSLFMKLLATPKK
jgi:hypothetical protein